VSQQIISDTVLFILSVCMLSSVDATECA